MNACVHACIHTCICAVSAVSAASAAAPPAFAAAVVVAVVAVSATEADPRVGGQGSTIGFGRPLAQAALPATSSVVAEASILVNGPLTRFDLRVGGSGSARLYPRVGGPGSTFGSAGH